MAPCTVRFCLQSTGARSHLQEKTKLSRHSQVCRCKLQIQLRFPVRMDPAVEPALADKFTTRSARPGARSASRRGGRSRRRHPPPRPRTPDAPSLCAPGAAPASCPPTGHDRAGSCRGGGCWAAIGGCSAGAGSRSPRDPRAGHSRAVTPGSGGSRSLVQPPCSRRASAAAQQ